MFNYFRDIAKRGPEVNTQILKFITQDADYPASNIHATFFSDEPKNPDLPYSHELIERVGMIPDAAYTAFSIIDLFIKPIQQPKQESDDPYTYVRNSAKALMILKEQAKEFNMHSEGKSWNAGTFFSDLETLVHYVADGINTMLLDAQQLVLAQRQYIEANFNKTVSSFRHEEIYYYRSLHDSFSMLLAKTLVPDLRNDELMKDIVQKVEFENEMRANLDPRDLRLDIREQLINAISTSKFGHDIMIGVFLNHEEYLNQLGNRAYVADLPDGALWFIYLLTQRYDDYATESYM